MAEDSKVVKKKTNSLSNKRLDAFKESLFDNNYSESQVTDIINILCKVIDYNPHYGSGQYNQKRYEQIKEWRKKKMDEYGVPIGVVTSGKYKTMSKILES